VSKAIFKNKVALITGGSRGIGKVIARAFLEEGAKVMLSARSKDELEGTKLEFKKIFDNVLVCPTDVSNINEVKFLVEETIGAFGSIDILINAAGIYGPIGPLVDVDVELWKKTYEINVFGTFQVLHTVLPVMIKKRYGKVINFSGGGDGPFPNFSAYNSSKAAIVRLTETLAAEMKDYHIDVNCIAPGPVNTRFLDEALAAGDKRVGKGKYEVFLKQKQEGGVPPEKAAELCVFLASPVSDGLSGKFLSAVWDKYDEWTSDEIKKISQGNALTLRRIKNE
jgi:NAD(P)-dependent dehydrogenase (short-subunit alcohol dehydrogenase family)